MITGRTAVFAILGRPVAHSGSPERMNAWFQRDRLDAAYVALAPEAADIGAWLVGSGLAGATLTAPFKTEVVAALGDLTPAARRVGAVNTAWPAADGWVGHNTDVEGIVATLDAHWADWRGRSVAVLGTGGAARAAVDAVADQAATLTIVARRPEAATWAHPHAVIGWSVPRADIVIDATSGDGAAAALLAETCPAAMWFDLSYARRHDKLRIQLATRGTRWIDGAALLDAVAAASYRTFRAHLAIPTG